MTPDTTTSQGRLTGSEWGLAMAPTGLPPERIADMDMIDWRPFRAEFQILFGDQDEIISLSTGSGWRQLVWDLCVTLEELARQQVAEGHHPMRVSQVKEKFGCLRFYLASGTGSLAEKAFELIEAAEERSGTICEQCGKPGKTQTLRGWDMTYCPDHWREALKEKRD